MLNALANDVRLAVRRLAKSPGYSAVIVSVIGLGLGLVIFVFSLVNAVVLRPLPFAAPNQLVQVLKEWQPYWLDRHETTSELEQREIRAWQADKSGPADIAAYQSRTAGLLLNGASEIVDCAEVSASLFSLLGTPPALGRVFLPEEGLPGGPAAAILSHRLWRTRFGADPGMVCRGISLEGKTYTVVGVMPASFRFFNSHDLYVPFLVGKTDGSPRVVARLKPDVSQARAESGLDRLYQQVCDPKEHGRIFLKPLHAFVFGDTKPGLMLYLGAVVFVLLIACANVANLMLARSVHRRGELALRMALGAGKWPLVRQVAVECLLLAYLGAGAGLLLAVWAGQLLYPLVAKLPGIVVVRMDTTVILFAFLVATAAAITFGAATAADASGLAPIQALKEGARGPRHRYPRQLFVIAEIMLATALLFGSGLLIKNYVRVQGIDLGFRPDKILYTRLELDTARYPKPESQAEYFAQVLARLNDLPGLEAVGAGAAPPLSKYEMMGTGPTLNGRTLTVRQDFVSPDYFRVLGIPLKHGRWFHNRDSAGKPQVVVVNESFVGAYLSNREPLGQQIDTGKETLTIVGVVGDTRHNGHLSEPQPMLYFCCLQSGEPAMGLLLRVRENPMKLAGAARGCIYSVDPQIKLSAFTTLDERLSETLAPQRINMWLSTFIGLLAVVLSVLGIYGMLAFSVAERTREIGIRMALGAQAGDVVKLIVGEGLVLTVAGMFFAILASYWLWWYVGAWMNELAILDWPTMAAACVFLGATAQAASFIPARRAVKIDPLAALRSE